MERKLALVGAVVALLVGAPLWGISSRQVVGYSFDWDDNLCYMPTTIVLFHKTTGAEREVSTEVWAEIRSHVGKPGEWADYEVRGDKKSGSFRYFGDLYDPEIFARHVAAARAGKDWEAPSWQAFLQAMRYWRTARWTTIISARGHEPATVRRVLLGLGLPHVPPEKNIHMVGGAEDPSGAKAELMLQILDRIQARGIDDDFVKVVNRDGVGAKQALHLWGFSDDDYGNFTKAATVLGAGFADGRWKDLKVTLFYTGKKPAKDAKHAPGAYVIRSDGTLRSVLPGELEEVADVVGNAEPCGPLMALE